MAGRCRAPPTTRSLARIATRRTRRGGAGSRPGLGGTPGVESLITSRVMAPVLPPVDPLSPLCCVLGAGCVNERARERASGRGRGGHRARTAPGATRRESEDRGGLPDDGSLCSLGSPVDERRAPGRSRGEPQGGHPRPQDPSARVPTGSYFVDVRRAAALAAAQGALAIIGSNSSELSRAVAEEAEARGLVQVSNVSTAHDLTWDPVSGKDRAFVFRVCSSDAQMGAQLARFTVGTLGARRAAVLFEVGRSYSSQLARSFIETFRSEVSPAAVTELRYLTQETDFRPQLREALTVRPDVLFVPGSFTDATLVASQAVSVGLAATLVGADGWSNPLLFSRGAPPGPAWFVDLCEPKEDYALRYREAFGAEAYGCRAMLASDALRSVVVALEAMGASRGRRPRARPRRATRRRLRDDWPWPRWTVRPVAFDSTPHGDRRRGVVLFSVETRKVESNLPHGRLARDR